MNYIWDLLISAAEQGIVPEKVYFTPAKSYSPYIELALEDINLQELHERIQIGINPYYRYERVFEHILPLKSDIQYIQLAMFDFFAHTLADVDLYRGMGRQDFEALFWREELASGSFGTAIASAFSRVESYKRLILSHCLAGVYRTGPSLEWLRYFIRTCYENGIVYLSKEDQSRVLVYLGDWRSDANESTTYLLEMLLLPLHFDAEWYYDQHFGIIGIDELMQMDKVVIC